MWRSYLSQMAAETPKLTKAAYEQLHRIQEYHSFASQAAFRVLVSVRNVVDRSRIWSRCLSTDEAEDVLGSLTPFVGLSDTMVARHREELERQRKNLSVVQGVLTSHQQSAFDTLSAAEELLAQSKRAGTHTCRTPLQPLSTGELHLLVEGGARLIAQDVLLRLRAIATMHRAASVQWDDSSSAIAAAFSTSLPVMDEALQAWQACDWLQRIKALQNSASGSPGEQEAPEMSSGSGDTLCQDVSELAWRVSGRSLTEWLEPIDGEPEVPQA